MELTRQASRSAPVTEMALPALAGSVALRPLTGADRLAYWRVDAELRSAWLVMRAATEADGTPIFHEDDVAWLAECEGAVVCQIAAHVRRVNGLTGDAPRRVLERLADDDEFRFAYRLALALGAPDADVLLSSMSSTAFLGWRMFFVLEPWGCHVEDERFGILTALLGNCNRDSKKRPEAFLAKDFYPRLDQARQVLPDEDPDLDREARLAEFLLHDMKLRAGAAGLAVDLNDVPALFLSPAHRAAREALAVDSPATVPSATPEAASWP